MFKNFINAFKVKEIRNKILLTILLVLIYRLGCWIPVPGVDASAFASQVSGDEGFLGLLSSVSGGALANGSLLALGIAPYISASIIIQLLTIAVPSLERLSKMGDEGRKKIAGYTKIAALVLAIAQAVAIVISFEGVLKESTLGDGLTLPTWFVGIVVTLVLIAGSMFTYWLGEKITELGISNGQSILIFVGILSTAGTSLLTNFTNIFKGDMGSLTELLLFILALILIFGFIVWIDGSERKVPVQYAKQIKGRKMYGGQSTFIPIRVNATGVMPIIFAMSLLSFPQLILSIFVDTSTNKFYLWYSKWLGAGSWVYIILVGLLITFFAYFWTQVTFNPDDVSKNIQQNGGFIPGIRPGKPTSDYLKKISNRVTLFGALFLSVIAIIPSLIFKSIGGSLVSAFSATGLLIVVSVAIEFDKSLEAQMLMKSYKGFLK
ncbi:MAG: preprotein translocase subunit SecY [Firmicutes bacterium]|nr:preprotein translocase subunit SecY [Bacillota bacterium]MDY5676742.1 preprotein translocase subunit SecY [Eubacteriales bacterium]